MALQRSGCFTKSSGVMDAIKKQMRLMNLKPVKRVVIRFDPFTESSKTIRDFNHLIVSKKVTKTNLLCSFKTEVLSDRSEGEVELLLNNGEKVLFKCNNLNTLEIFKLYNQYITPLTPKEEPVAQVVTKSEKKKKKK